jgi:hypothetical protein
MSRGSWSIGKEEAQGEHDMVAANHPLAAEVGVDVLKRGGNAVDAAAAMAFTLAVVEPYMNGLGGRGSMVIHLQRAKKTVVLDYNIRAPLAAPPRMYRLRAETPASVRPDHAPAKGLESARQFGPTVYAAAISWRSVPLQLLLFPSSPTRRGWRTRADDPGRIVPGTGP